MPETYKDMPILFFATAEDWEHWLSEHHEDKNGVWLKLANKSSGIQSAHHEDTLDVALCYGWIDGQGQRYDESYYLQKYTPRRPKSTWSQRNVKKVEQFIADGRMRPPGQAAIDAAKADGRWDLAYEAQSTAVPPPDFQAELDKNPKAQEFFDSLSKSNRYAFTWRVATAKRPETRQARIEKFITMLLEGKALH